MEFHVRLLDTSLWASRAYDDEEYENDPLAVKSAQRPYCFMRLISTSVSLSQLSIQDHIQEGSSSVLQTSLLIVATSLQASAFVSAFFNLHSSSNPASDSQDHLGGNVVKVAVITDKGDCKTLEPEPTPVFSLFQCVLPTKQNEAPDVKPSLLILALESESEVPMNRAHVLTRLLFEIIQAKNVVILSSFSNNMYLHEDTDALNFPLLRYLSTKNHFLGSASASLSRADSSPNHNPDHTDYPLLCLEPPNFDSGLAAAILSDRAFHGVSTALYMVIEETRKKTTAGTMCWEPVIQKEIATHFPSTQILGCSWKQYADKVAQLDHGSAIDNMYT